MEWQDIATAPTDGTPIKARIPDHGDNHIIEWTDTLYDGAGDEAGGWSYVSGDGVPECWSDGICWESNEYESPSIWPTHWKPLKKEDLN